MTDAIMIATIVVFFLVAALVVRALGRVTASAADEEPEDSEFEQEPERAEVGGERD